MAASSHAQKPTWRVQQHEEMEEYVLNGRPHRKGAGVASLYFRSTGKIHFWGEVSERKQTMFQWQVSQDRKKKEGVETPFLSASLILERVDLGEENDADMQRYEKTGKL